MLPPCGVESFDRGSGLGRNRQEAAAGAFAEQRDGFCEWDGVETEYSNVSQNLANPGLVNGNCDGTPNPSSTSIRAERAQLLYNILKCGAKK